MAVGARPEHVHVPVIETGAERGILREYVASVPDDTIISPDVVAEAFDLKSSTVSDRAPGTKRGKFRKIKRGA
jgi:hypothetical protein